MNKATSHNHSKPLKLPWLERLFGGMIALLTTYILLAYFVLPAWWRNYEHNPQLELAPKTTKTAEGIPGDALNIGLVGTKTEVIQALLAAGWYPADPITFGSSLGIVKSVLLKKPDPKAPVSNLYLFGRKQDLAFELSAGKSAKQRHHVRFWQSGQKGTEGRPLWLGSVTFDRSVGISHFTAEVTHHIAADVDAERDSLVEKLVSVKQVQSSYQVTGVGATLQGRNGGGDWYYTDGELTVAVLAVNNIPQTTPPPQQKNPEQVEVKNHLWLLLRHWF
ncbi:MAG: LssY C-terminal domain-containing protein [Coleofasciculaceae cyanobacterium]